MSDENYKTVNFEKLDPVIKKNGCLQKCKIFFEKRHGSRGPFMYCHKCENSISIGARGDIDEPCGVCPVCKGYLFWRVNGNGQRWQACWSYHKHFTKKTT